MAGKKQPKKQARKVAGKSIPPLQAIRAQPVESPELQADRERLAQVRGERWQNLLATFPDNQQLASWAARMADQHGPMVRVHENVVDWRLAFYIVRFGENEAYWPAELGDDEIRRALTWERGQAPLGVSYLPRPRVKER